MKKNKTEQIKENILHIDYTDEMQNSYIDYSISVITDRAIPDVRDGLKPVHRRILWAMRELGLKNSSPYKKSARIVGETMGKYHPHGDASIYDAMVHMAQNWCYIYPLVDGHGNFGSIDGDVQAASRYTEARLSKITEDLFLQDLDKNIVDFVPNFDDNEIEPAILPVKLPNLLLSGTEGIAVGMASKIPTHNLGELIDGTISILTNPKIKTKELMQYIKGPDFATGGIIANAKELPEIYENGCGKIRIRGKATVEQSAYGKTNIIITEIPYTMTGSVDSFIENIITLAQNKTMPDIQDIKNLSDKNGIKIVITLKSGANLQKNLDLLYKKGKLEDTFGYNALAICDGVPTQLSLLDILNKFISFNNENYRKKYQFLLKKEEHNKEIKEGLIKAIDCIDAIIAVLRGAKTISSAKKCLTKGDISEINFKSKTLSKQAQSFSFSEVQANAILEMKLQRLVGLELLSLQKELSEHNKKIEEYTNLLTSKTKMKNKIKSDLLQIKKDYALPRKTKLSNEKVIEITKEPILESNLIVFVDGYGYIKSLDEETYNKNKETFDNEYKYIIKCKSTEKICIFTDIGKCHLIKCTDIPFTKPKEKGTILQSITNIKPFENVLYIDSNKNLLSKQLFFLNSAGMGKVVSGAEFDASKRTIDSTKPNSDKLLLVCPTDKHTDIAIKTKENYFIRFKLTEVSEMKKTSIGVRCIKLNKNDSIESAKVGDAKSVIGEIPFKNIKLTKRDCYGTKKKNNS